MRYLFFIVFNKLYFFLVIIFLYFFDFGFKIFNEIVFFMLIYLFVCGFIILVMGKIWVFKVFFIGENLLLVECLFGRFFLVFIVMSFWWMVLGMGIDFLVVGFVYVLLVWFKIFWVMVWNIVSFCLVCGLIMLVMVKFCSFFEYFGRLLLMLLGIVDDIIFFSCFLWWGGGFGFFFFCFLWIIILDFIDVMIVFWDLVFIFIIGKVFVKEWNLKGWNNLINWYDWMKW